MKLVHNKWLGFLKFIPSKIILVQHLKAMIKLMMMQIWEKKQKAKKHSGFSNNQVASNHILASIKQRKDHYIENKKQSSTIQDWDKCFCAHTYMNLVISPLFRKTEKTLIFTKVSNFFFNSKSFDIGRHFFRFRPPRTSGHMKKTSDVKKNSDGLIRKKRVGAL